MNQTLKNSSRDKVCKIAKRPAEEGLFKSPRISSPNRTKTNHQPDICRTNKKKFAAKTRKKQAVQRLCK